MYTNTKKKKKTTHEGNPGAPELHFFLLSRDDYPFRDRQILITFEEKKKNKQTNRSS